MIRSSLLSWLSPKARHLPFHVKNVVTSTCAQCRLSYRTSTKSVHLRFSYLDLTYRTFGRFSAPKTCPRGFSSYSTEPRKYVEFHERVTVEELAKQMNVLPRPILELVEVLDYDTSDGLKTELNADAAELVAEEFGYYLRNAMSAEVLSVVRPPVVTIMGHVDHGKTTLLDYLRHTSVASKEAGGITQSIGAFSVHVPDLTKDKKKIPDTITFVDTPGHAAFNAMRARGAVLTDMVVLVVAADDGVMVQTEECLKHIQSCRVPFIVAINKIDAPQADTLKVRNQFLNYGIQFEGEGGYTKCVEISALKGTNIEELLLVLNQFAKENTFHASQDELMEGIVMEVSQYSTIGKTASVLVKNGTLTLKQNLVASNGATCSVRQLTSPTGKGVEVAYPSDPVQIVGWSTLPQPGDKVIQVEDRAIAVKVSKARHSNKQQENKSGNKQQRQPLTDPIKERQESGNRRNLFQESPSAFHRAVSQRKYDMRASAAREKESRQLEINVIVKTDVSGSLEALVDVLSRFHSPHLNLNVISAGIGSATLSDIQLADTTGAIVYCFNTPSSSDSSEKAESLAVELVHFDVIYELLDDLKAKIENVLPAKVSEDVIGEAEVLGVFKTQGRRVAGCRVLTGQLLRHQENAMWRVKRDNDVIHNGSIKSLKHVKEDITAAKRFTECGVGLDFNDFKVGDRILCIQQIITPRTFEWKL